MRIVAYTWWLMLAVLSLSFGGDARIYSGVSHYVMSYALSLHCAFLYHEASITIFRRPPVSGIIWLRVEHEISSPRDVDDGAASTFMPYSPATSFTENFSAIIVWRGTALKAIRLFCSVDDITHNNILMMHMIFQNRCDNGHYGLSCLIFHFVSVVFDFSLHPLQ